MFYLPHSRDPHYPTLSGPITLGLALATVTAVANAWFFDWGGWLWLVGGLIFLCLAAVMRYGASARRGPDATA
jgi:hypothetical protein